jgi:hypothetical protein
MVHSVRSWWLVAVIFMTLGVALETSASPARGICDGNGQIVPGQRVGPITLGMPLTGAQALLRDGEGATRPRLSPRQLGVL